MAATTIYALNYQFSYLATGQSPSVRRYTFLLNSSKKYYRASLFLDTKAAVPYSKAMKYYVYALCDPRSIDVIRYVGMSSNLTKRFYKHVVRPNSKASRQWIGELDLAGLSPSVRVLSEHDTINDATEAEHAEIVTRQSDPLLLNGPTNNYRSVSIPKTPSINIDSFDKGSLQHAEAELIVRTLRDCGGNKLMSAKRLGIGRQTLYNKIKLYGIAA